MQRAFSRQVSLGSGVTVLDMDRGGRNGGGRGQRALPRSGRSLGVLNHSGVLGQASGDGAARRGGDFSMFRTKSTLSKQNSLLPTRIRESDLDLPTHVEDQQSAQGRRRTSSPPAATSPRSAALSSTKSA